MLTFWHSILGVKQFEDQLYTEIRARIKEDDISVPIRRGKYYYYLRTLQGKEYVLHCRRLITNETNASVHDVMPIGPEDPEEHVILNENIKAQGHDYYSIGAFRVIHDFFLTFQCSFFSLQVSHFCTCVYRLARIIIL